METLDEDVIWASMEGRSRTSIRKAQRLGYTASVRPVEIADITSLGSFRSLYENAMRTRAAAARYFFPGDYYRALLAGLHENLLLSEVVSPDGVPAAACLLMRHGPLLHYHLSGTHPDFARDGVTNLLLWDAACWASRNGVKRFHLGGGISPGDNLFKFKRSFGGEVMTYTSVGIVLDDRAYSRAMEKRAKQTRLSVERLEGSSFFPQFRSPT